MTLTRIKEMNDLISVMISPDFDFSVLHMQKKRALENLQCVIVNCSVASDIDLCLFIYLK